MTSIHQVAPNNSLDDRSGMKRDDMKEKHQEEECT
jgi:hypothetical protein